MHLMLIFSLDSTIIARNHWMLLHLIPNSCVTRKLLTLHSLDKWPQWSTRFEYTTCNEAPVETTTGFIFKGKWSLPKTKCVVALSYHRTSPPPATFSRSPCGHRSLWLPHHHHSRSTCAALSPKITTIHVHFSSERARETDAFCKYLLYIYYWRRLCMYVYLQE